MKSLKNRLLPTGRIGYFCFFCGWMALALPAMATLEKEFVWESFGHQESLKLKLPAELQAHYSSKTRTFNYGNYVQEDAGHELNAKLAQAFQDRATEESLTEWQLAMATAVLALLPPVAVVIGMQKLFVKGLVETEK